MRSVRLGSDIERGAMTIQPAAPARITSLLMAAYGLTGRGEEITRQVLQGSSTAEIAAALTISPSTVQDHLKKVFDKTSVHSRRELTGKVFARHDEPRIEDNTERLEDVQQVVWTDHGHDPHRVDPVRFAATVRDFEPAR